MCAGAIITPGGHGVLRGPGREGGGPAARCWTCCRALQPPPPGIRRVLKEECAALLQDFFHDLRKNSPDFPQN